MSYVVLSYGQIAEAICDYVEAHDLVDKDAKSVVVNIEVKPRWFGDADVRAVVRVRR